jgi:integrase
MHGIRLWGSNDEEATLAISSCVQRRSLGAAVRGYISSAAFVALAPSSKRVRRDILEGLARERGYLPIAGMKRQHVNALLDAKAGLPGAALNLLSALRVLMRYAVDVGLRADNPTDGARRPKLREGGFYPWTEADIVAFEQRHPVGTKARLALALLLYTAQRRGDVIKFGRQHIRDGCIHLRQAKTGKALAIPVHPELKAILEAMPGDNLTLLVSQTGAPFSSDGFYAWFRRCCKEAGITPAATAPWAQESSLQAPSRGRVFGGCDRINQRPQKPARGRALYRFR